MHMKKLIYILAIVTIIIAVWSMFGSKKAEAPAGSESAKQAAPAGKAPATGTSYSSTGTKTVAVVTPGAATPVDGTYVLAGQKVKLTSGSSVSPKAAIFGIPVYGDIGKGAGTAVVIIWMKSGNYTNYYVASAYRAGMFYGTNGILLGRDISRPTINIANGVAKLTYAVRRSDGTLSAMQAKTVKISGTTLVQK